MKDPAALLYIDTWLSSTAGMDADCRGWYLNLLLHQYDKKELPNDIETLAVLANVKFSEFERFKQVFEQVLRQKFEQNESGNLENPQASEIIRKRETFKDKRSNSGTIGYIIKVAKAEVSKKEGFLEYVKENVDINNTNTKDKQVLKQVLEHLLKLYKNENGGEDKNEGVKENINIFYNEILEYFSEDLQPDSEQKAENWKDTLDKLLRIEKYSQEQIKYMVSWARNDDFWSTNFLSLPKLRKKNKEGIKYCTVFEQKIRNSKQNKNLEATRSFVED